MAKVGAIPEAQKAQSFGNVLTFFYEKLTKKFRNTQIVPLVPGKHFRSSDMAC